VYFFSRRGGGNLQKSGHAPKIQCFFFPKIPWISLEMLIEIGPLQKISSYLLRRFVRSWLRNFLWEKKLSSIFPPLGEKKKIILRLNENFPFVRNLIINKHPSPRQSTKNTFDFWCFQIPLHLREQSLTEPIIDFSHLLTRFPENFFSKNCQSFSLVLTILARIQNSQKFSTLQIGSYLKRWRGLESWSVGFDSQDLLVFFSCSWDSFNKPHHIKISKILLFQNHLWYSRGRYNSINHPTHMGVSSIFLEIWSFKVWAQISSDQRNPLTTPKNSLFEIFKFDVIQKGWMPITWSRVTSGPLPLASNNIWFASLGTINFTYPSKTSSSSLDRWEMKPRGWGLYLKYLTLLSIDLLSKPWKMRSPRKMINSGSEGMRFLWLRM